MKRFFGNVFVDICLVCSILGAICAVIQKDWSELLWAAGAAVWIADYRGKELELEDEKKEKQDYVSHTDEMQVMYAAEVQKNVQLSVDLDAANEKVQELTAALETAKERNKAGLRKVKMVPGEKTKLSDQDKKRIKEEMKSAGLESNK